MQNFDVVHCFDILYSMVGLVVKLTELNEEQHLSNKAQGVVRFQENIARYDEVSPEGGARGGYRVMSAIFLKSNKLRVPYCDCTKTKQTRPTLVINNIVNR